MKKKEEKMVANNSASRQKNKKSFFRPHRKNTLNITIDSRLLNNIVRYVLFVQSLE